MANRSGVRGRRTRVYDCNYNMGESYYRPALDRLDRKASGRPLDAGAGAAPAASRASEIEERHARAFADEDLAASRRRAERAIVEEGVFDSRGARTQLGRGGGRPLSAALEEAENEFDEEVNNSLRRLRASKKKTLFVDDVDMESTVASLQNRSRLGLAEKILESAGVGVDSETTSRRRVAARSSAADREEATVRWTAVENSSSTTSERQSDSTAAQRARASRLRLSDLEEESSAMQQRQAARDRRAADLRAFLADENIERVY